ncbi:thyrotropin-releasing hormone-degrading ectoenzyme-like [Branchiostoma floridae]|uniref:Aminopeptidase n=1 Tax=Branchiostoma floridae TaxID=7739 RepID=A0A9J7MJZ2_BRAFL|nr:thyrotropin-releasing hormone-degrading ectoenzyme-like [Branchiostoma floridae]
MEMHTNKSDTNARSTRKKVAYVAVLALVIILISVIVASLVHRKILGDSSVEDPPWHRARLPKSLVPQHYRLELKPDLEASVFTGAVEITLYCLEPTRYIVLHANLLNITADSVFLKTFRGGSLTLEDWFLYPKNEFLVLKSKTSLETGQRYVIGIKFQGQLLEDMRGFYRSYYTANSTRRYLAVSQFAPMDARKAFPCFDEPAMKATFDVTLVHQSEHSSLSNMQIRQSEVRSGGWVADHYYTTVRMSTYLLAFVISDFSFKEGVTGVHGNVTLRVWAQRNAVTGGEVDYALSVARRVLVYYENTFKIPYPLPKLDIVAVPQMGVPAMENWGLVVSHENRLLYAPQLSPVWKKEAVASMIAHELAHMWFGNLVTPVWWDGVWLKEGLATWAAVRGVDAAEPTWMVKERYFVQSLHQILLVDSSNLSHPLQLTVTGQDDVGRVYDQLSYKKGASLMRMLNTVLDGTFTKGIVKYLQKYKYANAAQDDLWECLTEAAQEDGRTDVQVKDVMDTWTLQMGFPVVTVIRNYSNGSVTVSQRHFLYDPEANVQESLRNNVWQVPLAFMSRDSGNVSRDNGAMSSRDVLWLKKREEDFRSSIDASSWLLANTNQTGYYRVNYDVTNWRLMAEDLNSDNFQNIPSQSRAGLIDDAFNLVRSGDLAPAVALNLSRYLKREREYLPWLAAERVFGYLHMMLADTNSSSDLKVCGSLLAPVYHELGWEHSGEHTTQLNRLTVLSMACQYGYPECLQVARGRKEALDNGGSVEPSMKAIILQYGSNRTGSGLVAAILNRTRILVDSGLFTKEDLLNKLMTLVDSKEEKKLVFDFLRNNWDYMIEGSTVPSGLINKLTEEFTTHKDLRQFEDFLTSHPNMASRSDVTAALERIRQHVLWRERNEDAVRDWLARERYGRGTRTP